MVFLLKKRKEKKHPLSIGLYKLPLTKIEKKTFDYFMVRASLVRRLLLLSGPIPPYGE